MDIYVIEMVLHDDLITTHIFLSQVNAYRKFVELLGEYYDLYEIQRMWLIKRTINDENGKWTDNVLDKMDSKLLELSDSDIE